MTFLRGFASDFTAAVKSTAKDVNEAFDRVISDVDPQERFAASFRIGEPLLGDFACKAVSGQSSVVGFAYVTPNYYCFEGFTPTGAPVRVVIPFKKVDDVKQAIAVASVTPGSPLLLPISDPRVKPNAIQLFTNDKLMHQFYQIDNYDRSWAITCTAWQSNRSQQHQNLVKSSTASPTYPPAPAASSPSGAASSSASTAAPSSSSTDAAKGQ